MKRWLYILAAALVLPACTNPDPVRDYLIARSGALEAPAEVSYDPVASTATVLGVYWDATAPLNDGAVSFQIQISSDEYFFEGDGSTLITQTIYTNASPNDAVLVSGLTSGQSYFVRVAAVYPGPSKSEWAYLNDASGKPAAVVPGTGIVE